MFSPKKSAQKATLVLYLSLTGAADVLAVPAISSVSQDPNDPSILIISGSGFTQKKEASPLFFFDFENGHTAQSDLSLVKDTVNGLGITTSETSPTGEGSVFKYSVTGDYRLTPFPAIELDVPPDRLYVYFHRRYNFSITDQSIWHSRGLNLKVNRFWGNKNNIYLGYEGREGASSGRIYPEYTALEHSEWPGSVLKQTKNQWQQEEIVYKAGDIDVQNGIFDVIRDGELSYERRFRMRTKDYPSKYNKFYFDQISTITSDPKNLFIFFDNIYIDNSFHRVYISQSPQFSEAKKRLIQVPRLWNDKRVEVHLNSGGMSLDSLFLYIADENGKVNSKGAKVCQSNCEAATDTLYAPAPPTLIIE